MDNKNRFHRPIIDELNVRLADKFFVNFSLFQSLPDAWGIDQVFPVLPLSGLTEAPKKRAVLLDITCDSDGALEHYVDGQGIESTLPVPEFSAAIVNMDEQGVASITEINQGDTVADMMRYVHLDVESFQQSYEQLVSTKIEKHEQQSVLDELQSGLDGYTYLEEL